MFLCLTRILGANVPEKTVDECGWNKKVRKLFTDGMGFFKRA
jgi:hypothetical protein